jgi:hypothetical protein
VQASIQSNTYVIQGQAQDKQISELLPGIISQLGQENLDALKVGTCVCVCVCACVPLRAYLYICIQE